MVKSMAKQSKGQREWYERNREKQLQSVKVARRKIFLEVQSYKAEKGCSRCAEDDPVCLEFHHSDPDAKEFSIALGLRNGYAVKRVQEEMQKCVVLCSNCHKKEHAALVDR